MHNPGAHFAIDARHHPVGSVALSKMMRTRRQVPVTEVMDEEMHEIDVTMDQEDVAFFFRLRRPYLLKDQRRRKIRGGLQLFEVQEMNRLCLASP